MELIGGILLGIVGLIAIPKLWRSLESQGRKPFSFKPSITPKKGA